MYDKRKAESPIHLIHPQIFAYIHLFLVLGWRLARTARQADAVSCQELLGAAGKERNSSACPSERLAF